MASEIWETGYDPYEQLLAVQAGLEALEQSQQQIIGVINHQSRVIQQQAQLMEQMEKKIKQLEEGK